jgi:hypothetical protein
MAARLSEEVQRGAHSTSCTLLPTPSVRSTGALQAGPVWAPDPWGRGKPERATARTGGGMRFAEGV